MFYNIFFKNTEEFSVFILRRKIDGSENLSLALFLTIRTLEAQLNHVQTLLLAVPATHWEFTSSCIRCRNNARHKGKTIYQL